MSADMQDLMARLQISLGQQANQGPSLYGLQAQQDPNQTAAILKKLQDQAYVSQQGNGPNAGEFGMINSQAKKDAARFGQGLGNLLGVGQSPQYDNSATMQQRAAIQGGKGQLADALSQPGADPLQARVDVLSKLTQSGVPGAADLLAKAQDDLIKMQTSKAQAFKDTSQGSAALDEIQNRAQQRDMDQKKFGQTTAKDTWTTIGQGNGYIVQKNGLGEIQTKKNMDTASSNAASITPEALQTMIDQRLTTGKDPAAISKAGLAVPYYNALAARLAATGDTIGAANAQASGYKAAGQSLDLTTKQLTNTQTSGLQIEKNISSLQGVTARLGGIGSPVMQKALNQWNQGVVGDKDTAQAVFYINELQNELARISSGSFGNVPLTDAAKADAKDLINKSMLGTGSLDGVYLASRQSYANKMDSLKETKQGLIDTLSQNAKGSLLGRQPQASVAAQPPAAAAPPVATPSTLNYNPKTGKFE